VIIPGYEDIVLVVHPIIDNPDNAWTISEASTGRRCLGRWPETAEAAAASILEYFSEHQITPEKLREHIAKGLAEAAK
jgi:hypothetical protein